MKNGDHSKSIIFQVTHHFSYTSCLTLGPAILGQYLDLQNLGLKEPEVRRIIMYCLKYYKTGLKPFCFSGPDLCAVLAIWSTPPTYTIVTSRILRNSELSTHMYSKLCSPTYVHRSPVGIKNSNTLEPDQPTSCVIAQQYSFTDIVSLRFHSSME
jgi:hypothetical protein